MQVRLESCYRLPILVDSTSVKHFRYPAETMKQVAELSKDVAADFRASREGKLKRTFVGADDAAAARYNNNRKK